MFKANFIYFFQTSNQKPIWIPDLLQQMDLEVQKKKKKKRLLPAAFEG